MNLLQRETVHFGKLFGLVKLLSPQQSRKPGLWTTFADAANPKTGDEIVPERGGAFENHRIFLIDACV